MKYYTCDTETSGLEFTQDNINMVNVAERRFFIWKLELWWIAFDKAEFHPPERSHIKGNWFWRK